MNRLPRVALVLMLAAVSVGGCAGGSEPLVDRPSQSAPFPTPVGEQNELTKKVVGMLEEHAVALAEDQDYEVRIVSRDGVGFPGTADFREDRINLTIQTGVVRAAHVG